MSRAPSTCFPPGKGAESTALRSPAHRPCRAKNHPMGEPTGHRRWLAALLAARPHSAPAMTTDRPLIAVAFAAGFAVALAGVRIHRQDVASITDEFAYLLQADTFARGRLSLPTPAQPEFFETPHVLVE